MGRQGFTIEDRGEYYLYNYGHTKGKYGIGFLVKKQPSLEVMDFIGITDRIALIHIKLFGKIYS